MRGGRHGAQLPGDHMSSLALMGLGRSFNGPVVRLGSAGCGKFPCYQHRCSQQSWLWHFPLIDGLTAFDKRGRIAEQVVKAGIIADKTSV